MKKLIFAALVAAAFAPAATAEEATLNLGNYDSAALMAGQAWEHGMPINYGYTYSGGQFLYTYDMLKDIADKNGEISKITFKMYEEGTHYIDLEGTSTLWASPTDLTEIPKNADGKYYLAEFSKTYATTVSADYEVTYGPCDFEVTYTFSTPVKLRPGQGVLFTAATEITGEVATSPSDFDFYACKAADSGVFAIYAASDTKSIEDQYADKTAQGNRTSKWVPVAKIEYSYEDKLPPLEAPVITPKTNTALGPDDLVTITAEEGATILYTLELRGTPDQTYTEPFAITAPCTVTAIATMDNRDSSPAASASYTLKRAKAPVFTIPTGSELGANEKVIITAEEGAKILYTTAAEGTPDREYPAEGIAVSADCTVRAIAEMEGFFPSIESKASYTVSDLDAVIVGDYYAPTEDEYMFIGTNWYNAPIIPTYANSASQLLYLNSELTGFNDKTRIRTIKFRYFNQSCFTTYTSQMKLYIAAVDDTEFAYDNLNSKYRWFATDLATPLVVEDLEIDFGENYFESAELTVNLPDGGFEMPQGKQLLITVVNEAADELSNSEYPQFFKYNTTTRRAATFCSDRTNYAAALQLNDYITGGEGYYSQMTDYNQPSMKLYIDDLGTQGASDLTSGEAAAPDFDNADIFTLQGIRLQRRPEAAGVYILRQGDKARKVVVK